MPTFLVREMCRSLVFGLARLSLMWSLVRFGAAQPGLRCALAKLRWTAPCALLSRRAQEIASSVLVIFRLEWLTATVSARHLWLTMAKLSTQTVIMKHTQGMDPNSRALAWRAIS